MCWYMFLLSLATRAFEFAAHTNHTTPVHAGEAKPVCQAKQTEGLTSVGKG